MSSPFSTIEAFEGAIDGPTGGAIYTFAHVPIVNAIALIIAACLFIWFMVSSFSTRYEETSAEQSLQNLTMLILAGLLSLVGVGQSHTPSRTQAATQEATPVATSRSSFRVPVGLLGLVGLGSSGLRSTTRRQRRYYRRIRR
jgi:hypothetical protein